MKDQLIYDIGLHEGEDTVYYLRKGYRVLAIEASPVLCAYNEKKFAPAIASGQLIILNVGLSDRQGVLPFYINKRYSEWSSFDPEIGCRMNSPYEVVDVPTVTTEMLFEQYGLPHYVKVDIEGYDHFVIRALPEGGPLPQYFSCEAVHVEWLDLLYQKGYRKFKLINQAFMFQPVNLWLEKRWAFRKLEILYLKTKQRYGRWLPFRHPYASSGPFGAGTRGAWKSYEEVRESYQRFYQFEKKEAINNISWFDFHAAL